MSDTAPQLLVRPFRPDDAARVAAIWQACGLSRPQNDPHRDIARKQAVQPEGFLVAELAGQVHGTVMVGYDGTRGWLHLLGVHPQAQGRGLGRALVQAAERWLIARGGPKLNLQVRSDNTAVIQFYQRLGYQVDAVVSLGKRLIPD